MDLYNKCLKFSENPKSGSQVCEGLVTPLAIALACPGPYSVSTERRFKYYANCEILSVGGGSFRQPNPLITLYCGRCDRDTLEVSSSVAPVLLPSVSETNGCDW